ncbi:MAG: phosphate transport system substrate-binding protein [Actinomycetota bacterium]|jgi:phosphate transport system substrate-binding protein|nr:phosphate transport system substrate-binding protein [Actinomycetota bacterium]
MKTRRRAVVAGIVSLAVISAACSSKSSTSTGGTASTTNNGVPLTGAGSTFAAPIYTQWAKDFNAVESGAQINYQPIGSGGGIDAITKQTADFGASDAPLQTDALSAMPADVVQIPTVLGGLAIAYNLPGLSAPLNLDGATAADIFQGTITTWNDPAIAKLNAGVTLPNSPIRVAHRSDDSGSTFVFTSYLSSQSASFKKTVGADSTVQWPVGAGKDGSDGVAGYLVATEGSVGYVSYDYAVSNNLGSAAVKASDGSFVAPSVDSISAAGSDLKFPIAPDTNVLNSSTPGAYPIATTTYVIVYKSQSDQAKGQTLVDFLHWGLTTGQDTASSLNYAPLPSSIATQALAALATVTSNGQPITPSSGA